MNGDAEDLGAALARGVKPARLRLLRVVCPHDRTLLDVLRYNGAAYLVYRELTVNADQPLYWSEASGRVETDGRLWIGHQAPPVVGVLDGARDDLRLSLVCGCCTADVTPGWVREQLAAGCKRVLARTGSA